MNTGHTEQQLCKHRWRLHPKNRLWFCLLCKKVCECPHGMPLTDRCIYCDRAAHRIANPMPQFLVVPPLNFKDVSAEVAGYNLVQIEEGEDTVYLSIEEAKALRDWLTGVLEGQ